MLLSVSSMVSAQAGTNALTYASDWGLEKSTPGLVAFETWVNRHAAASDPAVKAKMVAEEGFALAQQRRQSFAELIRTNPAQALASTVPVSVRQQLPGEIISQLETRVAGIGDFSVVCVLPRATDSRSASIHRFVRLDGRTYHAQVYGRRATETTKYGIPLHGVALDDRLALHESGARQLEAGEAQETTRAFVDLRPPAFQTQDSSLPLLAEVGDWLCRFTTPEQLHLAEERLTAAEAGMSPKVKSPYGEIIRSLMGDASGTQSLPTPPPVEGPQPNKTWTQGQQQVLTIRVDFSDLPGGPYQLDGTEYTAAYVTNLVDSQVRPFFEQASYGQTTLSNTVTTQVYRMPLTAAAYATAYGYNQLYSDAEAAAATNYTLSNYDRIIVLFSYLGRFPGSSFNFAGMAHVGGVPIWINGQFTAWVVAHELGHTYGVWHAHLWNVTDNDPISDRGASLEYADPFDIMGAGGNYYPKSDFNPWFKWLLNWIHPEQIVTVTTSGIYRINRFDDSGANGTLALKIPKDSTRKYWIGYRCSLTNNASLQHGAYVIWGYNINQHSNLLDMTTPGNNTPQDAALAIGATFVDPATNLSIRPVAQGGTPPNEYLDIQVTFAPVPPLVLEQPTGQMVTPGQSAVFTVHAKGNPAPEYRWQKQARGSSLWSNLGDNATYCGAATPILIVNDTSGFMDGDQFRAVITNPLVCTNSSPAPLTVLPFGVTTLAGLAGCSRDPTDGVGRLAQFCRPQGVAVDAVGTVYVADTLNHTVRVIGSAGAVTTLAGLAGTSGSNDGTGTAAQFNWPTGVAVDASGNLYIADCSNHTIRKISPSGVVSTFAGLAGTIGASDGIGNNARFHDPSGVAVDGVGNVYVADTSNHTIRKITHTGAVSTFAGLAGVSGSTDGFGTIARFRYPQCVTTDPLGNVYVADLGNQTVRKITPSAMVSTWAGMAGIQGCADGMGTAAQFFDPASVAVDGAGNVYVADTGNHIIRKITPAGMVTTWAGLAGNSGSTDGTPSEARFYSPYGVAADLWGRVYVADSFNHTLRKIVPAPVPQLVAASMSNGVFQCHLNGLVGSTYVIQVSSDLVNWLAFSTSTIPAEGTVRFVDATMGNQPRRFYRALPLVSESITFPATSATIASPLIVSNGCILQIKDKRF